MPDRVSTLGQNQGHVIIEGASQQNKLLITFAYINQPLGTRFHSSFLKSTDCKKLFLNPGTNAWYQTGVPGVASNFSELIAFVRGFTVAFPDHEILCLGHSMGAFAALGVGVSIGADRILVSVPECVLNLPGSLSTRYLGDTKIDCGDLTAILSGNRKSAISIIVGTQTAFDLKVARQIEQFPLTSVIELNCRHETFPYLRDTGKLAPVLEAFVDGTPIRPLLEGL